MRSGLVRALLVLVFMTLSSIGAVGAVSTKKYPALDSVVDTLVQQHGFERSGLRRLFRTVVLRPEIIAIMERPYEALPWHEYRRGLVTEERTRLGVRFWEEHKDTLARAQERYGVPAELIVAIIGIETRYGTNVGNFSTLEALLTLTLDYPRRAEFFRRELIEFLLLARELGLDPATVKGSYAGALGLPQFIPSSYRAFAVDFDADNRRDLFGTPADAIGSVANFLRSHGWLPGQPVTEAAQVEGALHSWPNQVGTEPQLTLREWLGYGVVPRRERKDDQAAAIDESRRAALIALAGESGPDYHLGYNNFYVITRYNRSTNYAMAVHELARMMRARYAGKR